MSLRSVSSSVVKRWCEADPVDGTPQSYAPFQQEFQETFNVPFPMPDANQTAVTQPALNQPPPDIIRQIRQGLQNPQKRINVDTPEVPEAPDGTFSPSSACLSV
jgi:hypothetical protein